MRQLAGVPPAAERCRFSERRSPRRSCRAGTVADKIATLRVLDAAANRAREGLRVVEDYVRFVLDDRHLTGFASSCVTI